MEYREYEDIKLMIKKSYTDQDKKNHEDKINHFVEEYNRQNNNERYIKNNHHENVHLQYITNPNDNNHVAPL